MIVGVSTRRIFRQEERNGLGHQLGRSRTANFSDPTLDVVKWLGAPPCVIPQMLVTDDLAFYALAGRLDAFARHLPDVHTCNIDHLKVPF